MWTNKIHLVIIQPAGYVHSLGFIDPVRFFRYQLRCLGYEVTIGKNRPRFDAINFIFGAHLLFDAGLIERYRCVIVNLEQLGPGGAEVSDTYVQMLVRFPVVDYDGGNISFYRSGQSVPVLSFGYAPYLAKDDGKGELKARPVDVLFFGSINDRRRRLLKKVEEAGFLVRVLEFGVYGPERDEEIRQAKAVFNCHFYDTARFEQVRVFQCLSLGTPVISERTVNTKPSALFEESVFWAETENIKEFFQNFFNTNDFFELARDKLGGFKKANVFEQYASALSQLKTRFEEGGWVCEVWRPSQLHIGSGKDYMLGWLNVDVLNSAEPDLLLDLSCKIDFPVRFVSEIVGPVELDLQQFDIIYANNVLEHVADLVALMTNCLSLLKVEGEMVVEVPYEHAPTAWQDPTHVRALNEKSWIYYTDWFWYIGWFEYRFLLTHFSFLDEKLSECQRESAHFMRVHLKKVNTSIAERMTARTMRADFCGIPGDVF